MLALEARDNLFLVGVAQKNTPGFIEVVDEELGERLVLEAHSTEVIKMGKAKGDRIMVTIGSDNTIMVWNIKVLGSELSLRSYLVHSEEILANQEEQQEMLNETWQLKKQMTELIQQQK